MIAKQKNLRIFELFVEDDESFINYMDKNLLLLKDYLLLINGNLSSTMREYLQEKGCCYKEIEGCKIKLRAKEIQKQKPQEKIEIVHYVQDEQEIKKDQNTKVIKTPVRSGTIVEHDGDITIFSRVNSGAKVICGGNLSVFGLVDGVVECDGEYMILKEIGNGFAIFNGNIVEKELLDGKLKKISSTEDGLSVEDLV